MTSRLTPVDFDPEETVEENEHGEVWKPPDVPEGARLPMRKPCRAISRKQGKMVDMERGDELYIHYYGIIGEIAIWRKGETFGVDPDPPLEGRYRFVAPADGRYDIWLGGIGESSVHLCLWVIEGG